MDRVRLISYLVLFLKMVFFSTGVVHRDVGRLLWRVWAELATS